MGLEFFCDFAKISKYDIFESFYQAITYLTLTLSQQDKALNFYLTSQSGS